MAVTLVKEDGSGLANANAYEDASGALAYFANTGRTDAWKAYSADARLAALVNATTYMDDVYGDRYLGELNATTQDTQALLWPRQGLLLPSGAAILPANIPPEIPAACCEFALISAAGDLDPNPTYNASGRSVSYERVRVEGAVEKETHYDGGTGKVTKRRHPTAERVLRKWLRPVSRLVLRA